MNDLHRNKFQVFRIHTMKARRVSSGTDTHSQPRYHVNVICQYHAQAAFFPGKKPSPRELRSSGLLRSL